MITLFAPLGLLALIALAVPLLVHLWRPPPRVVRLGSLRFLRAGARQPVRNLRWRDLLLLALRCALLGVLALLLTQPLWHRPAAPAAKWALRSPDAVLAGEAAQAWAALLAEGYEARWLAPGFPVDRPSAAGTEDVWSLLAEADARLPAGAALAVAAPGLLASLQGARPELSRPVRWIASGVQARTPSAPPAQSAPLRLAIMAAADRAEDARRVRAAAIALGWDLATAGAPDWIIALGAVAPPETDASNVLRDADSAAPPVAVETRFAGARLRQRVAVVLANGEAVLERDGVGDPMLTESRLGGARRLRLFSRFHPDWMDAAGSTALALWLQEALTAAGAHLPADQRIVAATQAQPALAPDGTPRAELPDTKPVELTNLLWFLALGLFTAERLWNLRR